jgi:uncharacterized membrane protein YvbJ
MTDESPVRCQACGTENFPGSTYCSNCATRLDTDTQQAVARRRQEHVATGVRWPAVAAAGLLVIVILLIALFVTHVL